MRKSGLADSPFFTPQSSPKKVAAPLLEKPVPKKIKAKSPKTNMTPRYHDTKQPRHHDTTVPSNHGITTPRFYSADIELIRKTVKEVGKEAATHRFTIEEKRAIKKIRYKYENHGILTSENEIARIAVNFIIDDYNKNGENSLLDKVLKALKE